MSELVAFIFRDQFRAPEVLNELRRREFAWFRDLEQAVAVTVDEEGKARVHLSVDLSNHEGVGWAKVWGALLSSTLFIQATEVMAAAANGLSFSNQQALDIKRAGGETTPESSWWDEALAQSVNFKRDVSALIEPGGSAIFMLLRGADATLVLKQLRNYGDTLVHTTLSSDQDNKLVALLGLTKDRS